MPTTSAQINAQIGTASNPLDPKVTHQVPPFGGVNNYWIVSGGQQYPGRIRRCYTLDADSVGAQAASITSQLVAGWTP